MVDAISALQSNTGQAAASAAKHDEEYTNFLTLLTTQLQHQDPTSPMDSTEFTNQIVQFTSVEQQIQTNSNLETLSTLMLANMNSNAGSYLGTDAVIAGGFGNLDHDAGYNTIKWEYITPNEADTTGLAIFDADGEQVATFPAESDPGFHAFEWDGKDEDGNVLESGQYELRVLSFDADGEELNAPVQVTMRVSAVTTQGAEPIYTIGGQQYNRSQILQIKLPN